MLTSALGFSGRCDVMRWQVHYYEDGNVQLVCSKEIKQSVNVTVSASCTDTAVVRRMNTLLAIASMNDVRFKMFYVCM